MWHMFRPRENYPKRQAGLRQGAGKTISLVAALGLTIVTSGTGASGETRLTKTFGAWAVVCITPDGKAQRCSMFQKVRVLNKKTKRQVFVLMWLMRDKGLDKHQVSVLTPLGVDLDYGVVIRPDAAKPQSEAFGVCDRRGCLATFEMPAPLQEAMLKDEALVTAYKRRGGRVFKVKIELAGFGDARKFLADPVVR